MKQGCFILLVIWAATAGLDYALLRGTALEESWWIAVLLGLSVAISAANMWGIGIALAQRRSAAKDPSQWRDGELVAVSGRLYPLRSAFEAPISGRQALIAEYEIKKRRSGKSGGVESMYSGMRMAPCAIQTPIGSLRIVGYPIMGHISEDYVGRGIDNEEQALARTARYIASATFSPRSSNPMAAIRELGAVLSDEDGDLRIDNLGSAISPHEMQEDGGEPKLEELVLEELRHPSCDISERIVPAGAEVTIFGTYRAAKRAIDIGSGLSNLSHELRLGALAGNIRAKLRNSLIGTIFWSGAAVYAHHYVAQLIGFDLFEILAKMK